MIVDAESDSASLRLLAVDRLDAGTAVRSGWLVDLDHAADDVNAQFSLPSDSCGSDIAFAAPLNRDLIFTVDNNGNARVHRIPSGSPDAGI